MAATIRNSSIELLRIVTIGCVIAFFTIALLLEPIRKIYMYWG